MKRSGFSTIEVMVGASILLIIVAGSVSVLTPVSRAVAKSKTFGNMAKVEKLIRSQVYSQTDYSNFDNFKVELNGQTIAQHNRVIYIAEDLSAVADEATLPIRVQLKLVRTTTVPAKIGVIYQIGSEKYGLRNLGALDWPTDEQTFVNNQVKNDYSGDGSYAVIQIPERLGDSTFEKCPSGFMKGLTPSLSVVCWNFSGNPSPPWSIPTGYKLIETSTVAKIELNYSPLNKISCPNMSIPLNSGGSLSIPNLYVLKIINWSDVYPPKTAAQPVASRCERVIDFLKHDNNPSGDIPAAKVTSPTVNPEFATGACPDQMLYTKEAATGICKAKFNPNNIPLRVPASVLNGF